MIPCPGSSFHGIFPAKILEWVAISFSRGSSWPRDRTHISCIGRWILYHWAAWECQGALHFVVIFSWYLYMKNWVKETAVNRPLVMWQYAVGAGRHCIILCLGVPLHCELHRYFSHITSLWVGDINLDIHFFVISQQFSCICCHWPPDIPFHIVLVYILSSSF